MDEIIKNVDEIIKEYGLLNMDKIINSGKSMDDILRTLEAKRMDELVKTLREYEEALADYRKASEKLNQVRAKLTELLIPDTPIIYNGVRYVYRVITQNRVDARAVLKYIAKHPKYAKWLKPTIVKSIVSDYY